MLPAVLFQSAGLSSHPGVGAGVGAGAGDGVVSHGLGGAGVGEGAGPGSGGAVESHGSAAIVHATSRASATPWTFIMLTSRPTDKAG